MSRAIELLATDLPVRVVLTCGGCGTEWEPPHPLDDSEQARALSEGCPDCGDWLWLGELIEGGDRG